MKKKLKVLALFDAIRPTTIDQDLSAEMKTEDWKTEANVLAALGELGYTTEHLAIFDNLDLLRQKLESFAPDVIFNLADQFKNNRGFDQNIVSLLEMQGVPFTGCGATGLVLCKHKGTSKKILGYHHIHVPNFVVIPRGQRIARLKRPKFPILVKPVKEEASYGISQASFVTTDEQFKERVAFIHEKHDADVIAEEYIEGREFYVSVMGTLKLTVFPIRELVFGEVPPNEPRIATYKAKWDEEYRKRWGLQNPVPGGARPGAGRADRGDVQTHLPPAHDRGLCAHRPAADGGERDLFHRGESESDSRGGRGLRAFGGPGGIVVSAVDRSDHPAGDEDGAGLNKERRFANRRLDWRAVANRPS